MRDYLGGLAVELPAYLPRTYLGICLEVYLGIYLGVRPPISPWVHVRVKPGKGATMQRGTIDNLYAKSEVREQANKISKR